MPKIDTIRFAQLISRITGMLRDGQSLYAGDIEDLHNSVADCIIEPVIPPHADPKIINEMLSGIRDGNKIEAIKAYRTLTGFGLKDSKDAIELYLPVTGFTKEEMYRELNKLQLPTDHDEKIYNFIRNLTK